MVVVNIKMVINEDELFVLNYCKLGVIFWILIIILFDFYNNKWFFLVLIKL